MPSRRSAILIDCRWGQPSCADLERLASTGERPGKDYVELARALDGDVSDAHHMTEHALPLAQAVARRAGLAAGQLVEVGLRQRTYRDICAWSDQVGLPFALLMKLAGGRRDLVMIAQWTTRRKKAVFFKPLRVDT